MRKGAPIWCFNDFLERLKKAMTPDVLESIKCRLPGNQYDRIKWAIKNQNDCVDITKLNNIYEV